MPYKAAGPDEHKLGLELFFTDSPGIEGRVKKEPEDFIVNERSIDIEPMTDPELSLRDPTLPMLTYARVKTRNWETNRLVQMLAMGLGIGHDQVFFAGSKDKRAITTQLMAFQAPLEAVQKVHLPEVELSDFFRSPRTFKVGDLLGNNFEIMVRELRLPPETVEKNIVATTEQLGMIDGFPNFFGVQRFGIIRPVTHLIGKLIVQNKLEEAVLLYVGHPIKGEVAADFEARAEFDRCWDYEWALKNYPRHLVFERILIKYLISHPDDYTGAIMQFPKNLQTMFIHAYQSCLFNRILSARIRAGIPLNVPVVGDLVLPVDDYKLPVHKTWIPATEQNIEKLTRKCAEFKAYTSGVLFGSESKFAAGDFGELEQKMIEEEGIKAEDFVLPEIPPLSSKGSRRELLAPVSDFAYELKDDAVKFTFGLLKGVYATTFLREYMKSGVRSY